MGIDFESIWLLGEQIMGNFLVLQNGKFSDLTHTTTIISHVFQSFKKKSRPKQESSKLTLHCQKEEK